MSNLTLGELFSGIGGWSEAARMAGGITPIWCSEIDKYKNSVYAIRHKNIPNLGDIREIQSPPPADIFTVSFPCTGISVAGKGKGLEDKNSGLWFEANRIIGACRPRYVVIENGPNLTFRGLKYILGSLAGFGYDAEWTHLNGTQFGIQQLRKRLYLIAYSNKARQQVFGAGSIFRQLDYGKRSVTDFVYPGWPTRREIPEPRTFRSAHDLPSIIHRLECTGDAIIPIIGMYILECIKIHNNEQHRS